MSLLENPYFFALALVLIAAMGLGAGITAGKGTLQLINPFRKNQSGLKTESRTKEDCINCLKNLAQMFPCKDHSGMVTAITHMEQTATRIEGRINDLWGAMEDVQKDIKDLIKGGIK